MTLNSSEHVRRGSAQQWQIESVGSALLVRAPDEAASGLRELAAGLPPEPGRVAVVVAGGAAPALVDTDSGLTWELLRRLGPGAAARPRHGVRLVMSVPPDTDPAFLPGVARRLADALDLEIVAPTGPLVVPRAGQLFVTGAGRGWLTVRPTATGASASWAGPRYPAPEWQGNLPPKRVTSSPRVRVTAVPAGLWLHPADTPDGPAAVPFLAELEPERMTLFVTGSTDRDALATELLELCRLLLRSTSDPAGPASPPVVVTAVMIKDPPEGASSWPQWLADRLGQPVSARHGLAVRGSDGAQQVCLADAQGRMAWRPFVSETTYAPGGRSDPMAIRWTAPGANLIEVDSAGYALDDAWLVEVVAAGLWIRPRILPGGNVTGRLPARYLAPAAEAVAVVVGVAGAPEPPATTLAILGALLRQLPGPVIERLRLLIPPGTSRTTAHRLATSGFGGLSTIDPSGLIGPYSPVTGQGPARPVVSVPRSPRAEPPRTEPHRVELSGSASSGGALPGTASSGGAPPGSAPSGGALSGTGSSGGAPSGIALSGGAPSGTAPSGTAPSGGAPPGSAPSGTGSSGSAPSGTAPSGGALSGIAPSGIALSGGALAGTGPSPTEASPAESSRVSASPLEPPLTEPPYVAPRVDAGPPPVPARAPVPDLWRQRGGLVALTAGVDAGGTLQPVAAPEATRGRAGDRPIGAAPTVRPTSLGQRVWPAAGPSEAGDPVVSGPRTNADPAGTAALPGQVGAGTEPRAEGVQAAQEAGPAALATGGSTSGDPAAPRSSEPVTPVPGSTPDPPMTDWSGPAGMQAYSSVSAVPMTSFGGTASRVEIPAMGAVSAPPAGRQPTSTPPAGSGPASAPPAGLRPASAPPASSTPSASPKPSSAPRVPSAPAGSGPASAPPAGPKPSSAPPASSAPRVPSAPAGSASAPVPSIPAGSGPASAPPETRPASPAPPEAPTATSDRSAATDLPATATPSGVAAPHPGAAPPVDAAPPEAPAAPAPAAPAGSWDAPERLARDGRSEAPAASAQVEPAVSAGSRGRAGESTAAERPTASERLGDAPSAQGEPAVSAGPWDAAAESAADRLAAGGRSDVATANRPVERLGVSERPEDVAVPVLDEPPTQADATGEVPVGVASPEASAPPSGAEPSRPTESVPVEPPVAGEASDASARAGVPLSDEPEPAGDGSEPDAAPDAQARPSSPERRTPVLLKLRTALNPLRAGRGTPSPVPERIPTPREGTPHEPEPSVGGPMLARRGALPKPLRMPARPVGGFKLPEASALVPDLTLARQQLVRRKPPVRRSPGGLVEPTPLSPGLVQRGHALTPGTRSVPAKPSIPRLKPATPARPAASGSSTTPSVPRRPSVPATLPPATPTAAAAPSLPAAPDAEAATDAGPLPAEPGAGESPEPTEASLPPVQPDSATQEAPAAPEPSAVATPDLPAGDDADGGTEAPPAAPYVLSAERRSSVEERQMLRLALGWRYDTEAREIVVLLAERPGIRMAGAGEVEAMVADLVAVRSFLGDDPAGTVAAQRAGRVGTDAALLACLVSGLRRVPSYRGVTFAVVPGAAEKARADDWYPTGRLHWEPAPVVTGLRRAVIGPGDVEFVIWSVTGRRCEDFAPEREALPVVFSPNTRFGVLASEDADGGGLRVYLAEVRAGELARWTEGSGHPDERVLGRLRGVASTQSLDVPPLSVPPIGIGPDGHPFPLPAG